jgi:hypothetical protein
MMAITYEVLGTARKRVTKLPALERTGIQTDTA